MKFKKKLFEKVKTKKKTKQNIIPINSILWGGVQ